jgi:hypothetical protein
MRIASGVLIGIMKHLEGDEGSQAGYHDITEAMIGRKSSIVFYEDSAIALCNDMWGAAIESADMAK